jgi:hypothetical protein
VARTRDCNVITLRTDVPEGLVLLRQILRIPPPHRIRAAWAMMAVCAGGWTPDEAFRCYWPEALKKSREVRL